MIIKRLRDFYHPDSILKSEDKEGDKKNFKLFFKALLDTWIQESAEDDFIILQHLEEMVSEIMLGEVVATEIQKEL